MAHLGLSTIKSLPHRMAASLPRCQCPFSGACKVLHDHLQRTNHTISRAFSPFIHLSLCRVFQNRNESCLTSLSVLPLPQTVDTTGNGIFRPVSKQAWTYILFAVYSTFFPRLQAGQSANLAPYFVMHRTNERLETCTESEAQRLHRAA